MLNLYRNFMINFGSISRVPPRVRRDFRVFRLLLNWREAIYAELKKSPLSSLKFRNGISIEAPPMGQLDFLFHEIWIEQIYTPPGYGVAPGDVVIDIGANLGIFATYAAT